MDDTVYDPGVNTWNPPEASLSLNRIFTSLDETRSTSWTVDEHGSLQVTLDDRHEWPNPKQVKKYQKAVLAFIKNPKKPMPKWEDYVKTSDR